MKFTFEGEGVQELRDLGLFLIGGDPVREEGVADSGPEAAQRLNDAYIKAMNSLETENGKLQKALQDAGAHAAQLEQQVEELEAENKRLAETIIRLQSAPDPERKEEEAPAAEPEKTAPKRSLADVRGILAAAMKANKREQVSAILAAHGAKRVSDLAEEELDAVYAEAEALNA